MIDGIPVYIPGHHLFFLDGIGTRTIATPTVYTQHKRSQRIVNVVVTIGGTMYTDVYVKSPTRWIRNTGARVKNSFVESDWAVYLK